MNWKIISGVFGILFFAIGIVNTFWGNDMVFGIFIMAISILYFIPLNAVLLKTTGYKFSGAVKVILGIFILWASLGVGELFDKADMMLGDIRSILP
jgi:hypothetical protein